MARNNGDRPRPPRGGRPRGLQDIRTLRGLLKAAPLQPAHSASKVQVGLGAAERPAAGEAEHAQERPRAWVFVTRPRFERRQGRLSVDQLSEPDVEVFEEGQAVVVLAELPGAGADDIEVQVNGDVLALSTRPSPPDWRRYHRELLLPFAVSSQRVQRAFRNGVLELQLQRASTDETPERRSP